MENTIIIAIVSLLCILAHVPTLILRIVPFHEKISDKDRIRLTVIYAIGLAVDFRNLHVGGNPKLTCRFIR